MKLSKSSSWAALRCTGAQHAQVHQRPEVHSAYHATKYHGYLIQAHGCFLRIIFQSVMLFTHFSVLLFNRCIYFFSICSVLFKFCKKILFHIYLAEQFQSLASCEVFLKLTSHLTCSTITLQDKLHNRIAYKSQMLTIQGDYDGLTTTLKFDELTTVA